MAQMTWDELRQLPSAVDLETAGRALGIGRSKIYAMAKNGELQQTIRVLRLGHAYRVVTADLYRVLAVSPGDGPMTSAVCAPGRDEARDATAHGQQGGTGHPQAGAPQGGAGGRAKTRQATPRTATRPGNTAAS